MKHKCRYYLGCFLPAAKKWWKDRHADDAAALAFYSLISLVPLLLVSVYVASFVVDEERAKSIIISEADRVAGRSIGEYFASMLHAKISGAGAKFSPILGGLLLLFSSTKMISELRKSLAKVFGQKQKVKKVYSGLLARLTSIVMVVVLGIVVISAVAIETILGILNAASSDAGVWASLVSWLSPIASFVGVALLAALTMRWLPEKRPRLKEALAGGILSSLLLILLKIGVTKTIQYTDVGSYYGSAFTLVLVLFWIYFTMQVFLFGAEYAAELARRNEARFLARSTSQEKLADGSSEAEESDQPTLS